MKRRLLACGIIAGIITASFAFRHLNQSAITGKISPADAATEVWAIGGTDSAKAALQNGTFSISVKPGTYKVVIDAVEPYKDVTKESVTVSETAPTDLGEIVLEK